jgi:hypothetical protein
VFFKNHKGELIKEVEGNEGDDMVDLSWEWDLDIEGKREIPLQQTLPKKKRNSTEVGFD